MSARSRKLVSLATRNKNTDHVCNPQAEHHQASDLDESQERIANDMKQIISHTFFDEDDDDNTAESDLERPQISLQIPQRRVSETSSDSESLFSGDFSDNDPSYRPEEDKQQLSSDSDLITLQDLLGSNDSVSIPSVPISPQSDYDHQSEAFNDDFTTEAAALLVEDALSSKTNKNIPATSISPQPGTSHQYEDAADDGTATEIATLILEDVLALVWDQVKTITRWRIVNPHRWKKNVAKKRRAEGLPYTTNNQIRPPKVPKTIDCDNCTFKCTQSFNEQDRAQLCRSYWNLDFVSKKNFILSRVLVQPPKKVLVERKRPVRQYTTKYYFVLEEEKRQVCQKFFCSSLGISPSVVKDAIKQKNDLGLYCGEDGRGHQTPPNKTSPEKVQEVVDHISSFPTMEGHYVRKKSKRKYLDSTLSIGKMYRLYLDQYEKDDPVSEITYRRIFSTEFNLSFFVPKKDQCQVCNKYTTAKENDKITLEASYNEHIERKILCEAEKEKDKKKAGVDNTFLSVSFDLQAILQIPCSKVGLLYYVRKLTVYNLTIYESALPNNAFCFNWSEVHGKKGSAEIGTILYHYLSKCISTEVTSVSLFSDTCGGQNRNQNIAAILLWAVNKIDHLQVIEQKFLESGHSYMEADSMHSSIESAKKNKDVFSMTDWKNIFKSARSKGTYKIGNKKVNKAPYRVKEFKYNEFYDLKKLAEVTLQNKTKDCNGNKVLWLKIKKMKYVKNDTKIYFNYDVSDVYLNFDTSVVQPCRKKVTPQSGARQSIRKCRSNPSSVEPPATPVNIAERLDQLYEQRRAISAAKKKDLLSLCAKGVIPEEYHGWFHTLKSDSSIVDRVPDVPASESSSDEEDI